MNETPSIPTLEKVLNSNTFQNKEVIKGLLQYLYKASVKNRSVKEIDIAIDYFKRDQGFVSGDDTIVRVNVYKLRSLLDTYYAREGKDDNERITIPKGSYNVKCLNKKATNQEEKNLNTGKVFIIFILLISLVLNIVMIVNPLNSQTKYIHPVWNDYINHYKPISIILGDPFFYTHKDSADHSKIYRDFTINTDDSLQKHAESYIRTPYPYFSKNNLVPLPSIFESIAETKNKIFVNALSEVNSEQLKDCNHIFIGNINSFGFFSEYLSKSHIQINEYPRRISLNTDTDTTIFNVSENIGDLYTDYAFMVKIPGTNNNMITLMGDFHASALKGLSTLLNDHKKLNTLVTSYNKLNHQDFPKYFEMVVKVTSFHYSDLNTEIIYFKKLDFEDNDLFIVPEMMN